MFLSFCGSGFLGVYHLGVAEAFFLHGRNLLAKVSGFSGASSGALVATMLTTMEPDRKNLQCLLASCCIPYITGKDIIYINNEKYVDGGFSDNLPMVCSESISVSPFCGQQDICPQDKSLLNMHLVYAKQNFKVNYRNLRRGHHSMFPPNKDGMQMYFDQGFCDGIRYLRRKGFYT